MKIFYNLKTGEVLGTVDGFNDIASAGISIQPAGVDPNDIAEEVIDLGHPKEELARRLMDPLDPLKMVHLSGGLDGVEEMKEDQKEKVDAEIAESLAAQQSANALLASQPSVQDQILALQDQIDTIKKTL
jgi:hypothetical protein